MWIFEKRFDMLVANVKSSYCNFFFLNLDDLHCIVNCNFCFLNLDDLFIFTFSIQSCRVGFYVACLKYINGEF
jgi:hypothetical protein